ncbi:MAG: hypothetical protein ABJO02_00555 [Reichenbachiella sp.]|uniref:hypothetical protein n=1 Tax=Reichenbachiella sp. TaxID=2184521 RepID=UPI003298B50F
MKIGIIPTYKEVFGDDPPEFKNLIAGIPTKLIVGLVSVMNGELYLNQYDLSTHLKLLQFLLQRQSKNKQEEIYYKIAQQVRRKGLDDFSIFSTHLNLQFLHLSLLHYHEDETFEDTTPEQELRIFKAYLVSTSLLFGKMEIDTQTDSPLDYFRKNTWPMMIGQFMLNHPYNYFLAIAKSKCFFDALEFETEFGRYVRNFTERFQDPNSLAYIFRFVNILQLSQERDETKRFSPFSITSDAQSIPFFDELAIDLKKYSEFYSESKGNFTGLKEKPLYKVSEHSYVIMNWDFLARKVYDGMLFDFYNQSGISHEKRFLKFPAFKQFIGENAIEKYLFRRLIRGCFKNKHVIVEFDNGISSGHPDAYVRNGKKVFLFEIKDSLFSSRIIDSEKYDLIKSEIDKKYNTGKPKMKGTHQLLSQIKQLSNKPFESKSYDELKIKTRNLIIYPILIYTDPHFDLPGIGKYLDEEFRVLVESEGLDQKFEKIKNLTFLNIDFLVSHLNQLQKKDTSLDKLIDAAAFELKKREKRFIRTNSTDDLMLLNDNFHSLSSKYLKEFNSDGDYVKVLFDELKLSRGL